MGAGIDSILPNSENVKSESEKNRKKDNLRFSVVPEDEYKVAVANGDMEGVGEIVKDTARQAGFQIIPDLANIFNTFPDSVIAADGSRILIKNPDNGKISERLKHLISEKNNDNSERDSYAIRNKIPWLPRIVETIENAQAKLKIRKAIILLIFGHIQKVLFILL